MNLAHPFYRFPFRFDSVRLRQEIDSLPEQAWCKHPGGYAGNSGLPLITTHGGINDDFEAPLLPTPWLAELPYVRQVLSRFDTLLGRSRLMRLDAEANVPAHIDSHYHWRSHTRVHIPVITHPSVEFHCGDKMVNMSEGEAWTFDNWRMHKVVNPTAMQRIHLVFDTIGTASFWKLARPLGETIETPIIPYRPNEEPRLRFETRPADLIMAPGDVDFTLQDIMADAVACDTNNPAGLASLQTILLDLRRDWRTTWFASELNIESAGKFLLLTMKAREALKRVPELLLASNRYPVVPILIAMLEVFARPDALQILRKTAVIQSGMPSSKL